MKTDQSQSPMLAILVFFGLLLAAYQGIQHLGWEETFQTYDILGWLLIIPVFFVTLPVSIALRWVLIKLLES